MNLPERQMSWRASDISGPEPLLNQEWLVTNGLGGYAAGTVAGVITRAFHGYLIAALPSPLGRVMMLNDLVEAVHLSPKSAVRLGGEERRRSAAPRRPGFRRGIPVGDGATGLVLSHRGRAA